MSGYFVRLTQEVPGQSVHHLKRFVSGLNFCQSLRQFIYVVNLDGSLFGLGDNSHGQLGIGMIAQPPSPATPHAVKALLGVPLVEVSAGGYHSMALSLSGAVIGWGKNR